FFMFSSYISQDRLGAPSQRGTAGGTLPMPTRVADVVRGEWLSVGAAEENLFRRRHESDDEEDQLEENRQGKYSADKGVPARGIAVVKGSYDLDQLHNKVEQIDGEQGKEAVRRNAKAEPDHPGEDAIHAEDTEVPAFGQDNQIAQPEISVPEASHVEV